MKINNDGILYVGKTAFLYWEGSHRAVARWRYELNTSRGHQPLAAMSEFDSMCNQK